MPTIPSVNCYKYSNFTGKTAAGKLSCSKASQFKAPIGATIPISNLSPSLKKKTAIGSTECFHRWKESIAARRGSTTSARGGHRLTRIQLRGISSKDCTMR